MNRGLYIASSGMIAQRTKMDVITNNLANVDTIGYKTDDLIKRSFGDMMLQRYNGINGADGVMTVGPLGMGKHIDETVTYFTEGSYEETGETTDISVFGDGFFVVNTPQGDRYTRAGNFMVNSEGVLVNADGHFVMSTDNQRITVGSKDFVVDSNANITVAGEQVATIAVVDFADRGALAKEGSNLFTGAGAAPSENFALRQGFIETSNVDTAREVATMIMTNRAFEANQRIVKMFDESIAKTVNEIARF